MADITNPKDYVWEHRFSPKTLKDVILPTPYRNFFNKIVNAGASMNLILASSTPGTGKTTVAKALAHDLGCEFLLINASDENGVNTIRDKVVGFATSMSFDEKPKIIIFDEADRMSPDAQMTLRGYIDKFQDNCRFILTCNFIAKIIPALKEEGGRTMMFEFDMRKPEYTKELKEQIVKRMCGILKFEGIEYDTETVKALVEQHYPSIRSITTVLQKYSMMHGKIDSNILEYANIGDEFTKLILARKWTESRKYIAEKGLSYTDVYSFMMNYVVPELKNKGDAIINIADYEFKSNLSSDPSIQMAACLIELFACV